MFPFQTSSSSDSDFNDFHFLDQFLEEFYSSNNQRDNNLTIPKPLSSNTPSNGDEISNNSNDRNPINHHVLGEGDAIESNIDETNNATVEQPDCQYSIYQLLDRYENQFLS